MHLYDVTRCIPQGRERADICEVVVAQSDDGSRSNLCYRYRHHRHAPPSTCLSIEETTTTPQASFSDAHLLRAYSNPVTVGADDSQFRGSATSLRLHRQPSARNKWRVLNRC